MLGGGRDHNRKGKETIMREQKLIRERAPNKEESDAREENPK